MIKKIFIRNTEPSEVSKNKLGELKFRNGTIVDLLLPESIGGTYSVQVSGDQQVKGVYIHSHRPSFPYRAVKTIPTAVATREQIYSKYNVFSKAFAFDTYRNQDELSSTSLVKETLASLAIFGYGNQSVSPNTKARELFEGYMDILRIVLPPKLGFEKLSVVVPEVMLCTKTGDFPIDAVSGGISSIIDITWQLYMFADRNDFFVALIDEPENHLHPELQKSFLGSLIAAFPNVQFIVATHNPFMISAQKDSNVYVLNYTDDNQVYSIQLDCINRAGTSNAILRDVLGIGSSMPYWAEDILISIVNKYRDCELNNDSLSQLRNELTQIGLDDYIPDSIAKIIEERNDDTP
jgi:hypothetical protein